MNILALSSFGTMLEVGVRTVDGYYENRRQVGLKHNQILLEQIDCVLKDAGLNTRDLDIVACTQGPGSFTAIRILISTAKGLSAGTDASFITIPTFDVVGSLFSSLPFSIVPVLDGKKGKFYFAVYEGGKKILPETDASRSAIQTLLVTYPAILFVGETGEAASKFFQTGKDTALSIFSDFSLTKTLMSLASSVFDRGVKYDRMVAPLYVRKSDAELSKVEKHEL